MDEKNFSFHCNICGTTLTGRNESEKHLGTDHFESYKSLFCKGMPSSKERKTTQGHSELGENAYQVLISLKWRSRSFQERVENTEKYCCRRSVCKSDNTTSEEKRNENVNGK